MTYDVTRQSRRLGEYVRSWRMVQGVTSEQIAERAGISPVTLRKVENGDDGVRFGAVLQVARALGILDTMVDALDPLRTDLGRARADLINRKRAR